MWTVISSSSKGRMMVAAEDIPCGSLVLLESPAAYVPSYRNIGCGVPRYDYSLVEQSMLSAAFAATGEIFKGFAIILAARVIAASQNSASMHELIRHLCRNSFRADNTGTADIMASAQIVQRLLLGSSSQKECSQERCLEVLEKLECNAFTAVDHDLSSITGIGLYTKAAAINHSCQPNCCQTFNSSILSIRATKKIMKGEEITISYIDTGKSTWWRKNELFLSYGFSCSCPRCCTTDSSDSYICQIPNCKGMLEIIEKDLFFSWINSTLVIVKEDKEGKIPRVRKIVKNLKFLSSLEIVVPHGDILFENYPDCLEVLSSVLPAPLSLVPLSISPSMPSSSDFKYLTKEMKKEKKRRFQCSCCHHIIDHEAIMIKVLSIIKDLKDINSKKKQGYNCQSQCDNCIHSLLQIVPSWHPCVIELYRTYVLEDLILSNNFQSYVKTVRTSNYLSNIKNIYPRGHPFPAIQDVMYSKCLLQICQSQEDMNEAHTSLHSAIKVLSITHGVDSKLIMDIKEILRGIE